MNELQNAIENKLQLREHNIKVLTPFYERLVTGQKPFEVRKDDRDYQVGDLLFLEEFDGKDYAGSTIVRKITYKLSGGQFGIKKGYCVLGLKEH